MSVLVISQSVIIRMLIFDVWLSLLCKLVIWVGIYATGKCRTCLSFRTKIFSLSPAGLLRVGPARTQMADAAEMVDMAAIQPPAWATL